EHRSCARGWVGGGESTDNRSLWIFAFESSHQRTHVNRERVRQYDRTMTRARWQSRQLDAFQIVCWDIAHAQQCTRWETQRQQRETWLILQLAVAGDHRGGAAASQLFRLTDLQGVANQGFIVILVGRARKDNDQVRGFALERLQSAIEGCR